MDGTSVGHARAGHRRLPRTPDLVIEAWAPGREECIAEAVQALVECFADLGTATPTRTLSFAFPASTDDQLLVDVLEEALSVLEIFGMVPVAAHLERTDDGGVTGDFDVAEVGRVVLTGGPPRGVRLHELELACDDGWRALVTVDV